MEKLNNRKLENENNFENKNNDRLIKGRRSTILVA